MKMPVEAPLTSPNQAGMHDFRGWPKPVGIFRYAACMKRWASVFRRWPFTLPHIYIGDKLITVIQFIACING